MKKTLIFSALMGLFLLPHLTFAAFDTNLRYGAKGSAVTEMQEFLVDQGFLTGTATGNFYSLTLKAVKAFQAKEGLPATGYWGAMTRSVAQSKVDLADSDAEAGDTTVAKSDSQLFLEIMAQYKAKQEADNAALLAQLQAQTQATQQVVQNTTPVIQNTPVAAEVSTPSMTITQWDAEWNGSNWIVDFKVKNNSAQTVNVNSVNYSLSGVNLTLDNTTDSKQTMSVSSYYSSEATEEIGSAQASYTKTFSAPIVIAPNQDTTIVFKYRPGYGNIVWNQTSLKVTINSLNTSPTATVNTPVSNQAVATR